MKYILQDIPIGKNIKRLRIQKQLTQDELAIQLQLGGSIMSRSTLANIETGQRNIKASDLKLLKDLLDTTYEEFFVESNEEEVSDIR